jgi:ketosteroid isomerase-like protein
MSRAKDVILKHIEAFNCRDLDAEPWTDDAEFLAPVAQVSGRDQIIGFFNVFQSEHKERLRDRRAAEVPVFLRAVPALGSTPIY